MINYTLFQGDDFINDQLFETPLDAMQSLLKLREGYSFLGLQTSFAGKDNTMKLQVSNGDKIIVFVLVRQ
jgi:hypothetical protein